MHPGVKTTVVIVSSYRGFESNLVKDRNHQLYLQKTLRNESLKNHSWTEEEFRGEREYLLVILPCTFNC